MLQVGSAQNGFISYLKASLTDTESGCKSNHGRWKGSLACGKGASYCKVCRIKVGRFVRRGFPPVYRQSLLFSVRTCPAERPLAQLCAVYNEASAARRIVKVVSLGLE